MVIGAPGESGGSRRWSRGALPALIAIVVLVYLASQTLLPTDEPHTDDVAYSEAKALLRDAPERIGLVTFHPGTRKLEIELRDGRTLSAHYPADDSVPALEEVLERGEIRHDAAATGERPWVSFLSYLLPFVLFFAFWIFLLRRFQGMQRRQE
jgi:ATP-dependent Zn protease